HSIGTFSIATGTSCFLKILLRGVGQIHMYHCSHVSLVDPHTKSIRRHNHATLAIFPTVLFQILLFMREAGMKIIGRDTYLLKSMSYLFCLFATPNVDNAAARNSLQDVRKLSNLIVGRAHDI